MQPGHFTNLREAMHTQTGLRPARSSRIAGIALVNVATFAWATNIVMGRLLRDDVGPLTLAAARFAIASLFLYALLRRQPPAERRVGSDRWLLLAMAVSGVVLFAPILYLGLRFTTAVNASLISGLAPLITGILAALLIHEPMSRRQAGGSGIALLGVVFLVSGGSLAFWRLMQPNPGDLIVLAGAALWALYSVLGRRVMRHRSALSATAFSAFFGLPFLILAASWEIRVIPVDLTPGLLAAIVYVGLVPTVLGLLAWNEGVRRLGASGAMVFYSTLPLYGALLGYLLLGEPVGPAHLLGGALIIGGGIWGSRGAPASSASE
jgi:drug/metabolite transporter (DMT)-like permease